MQRAKPIVAGKNGNSEWLFCELLTIAFELPSHLLSSNPDESTSTSQLRDPKSRISSRAPKRVPMPGTPNNQKEMVVSPNNHFLCKGFQLPYWNNHLFLVVWGSRWNQWLCPLPSSTHISHRLHYILEAGQSHGLTATPSGPPVMRSRLHEGSGG